jgi:hypothetical protein
MSSDKTYSKKEISKILTKASEIQTAKDLYDDEQGLTEQELLHVADEVGISKESLQKALFNFDTIESEDDFDWLGGTGKIHKEVYIEGKLTEEKWNKVIHEIRKITGGIGKISKVGSSHEWEQRRREIGYRHLTLTPEGDKTRVKYLYNWRGVKIYSMFLPFVALFTITAITLDGSNFTDIPSLLIAFGGGLLGLPLGRMYLKSYFSKQKQQVKSLFSGVTKIVNESANRQKINIEGNEVYNTEQKPASSSPAERTRS